MFHQSYCLFCHEPIQGNVSWGDLFAPEQQQYLCSICESRLQKIEGEVCHICNRPFEQLEPQYRNGDHCTDCTRWEEDPQYKGVLTKNHSFYIYNEFMKEIIAKFKYRGDYILARIFQKKINLTIKRLKPTAIIPIPLSEERLHERGFNQAEALILEAGLQSANVLTRIHTEKQSKKSRTERIHLPQVFDSIQPLNGTIALMDDIYTTGSTLRQAANILKRAGAEEVHSITIARG